MRASTRLFPLPDVDRSRGIWFGQVQAVLTGVNRDWKMRCSRCGFRWFAVGFAEAAWSAAEHDRGHSWRCRLVGWVRRWW